MKQIFSKKFIGLVKETLVAVFSLVLVSSPLLAYADSINRQLELGSSGSDVSVLQTFLAQDDTIYPQGLVTGYFGSLTKSAVSNFQSRNDIPTVGRVGPVTMVAINNQIANGMGGVSNADIYAPSVTNININRTGGVANISWNTSEPARGVVYYSNNPLVTVEHLHTVDISGNTAIMDSNLRNSQNVSISGLQANTVYYYIIYATDAFGNVTMTMPATFISI